MQTTIVLMAFAFVVGIFVDHIFVKENSRRKIRTIMKRQKEDPNWYEAKSDAKAIGCMLEERALMYLPTNGIAFPDASQVASKVFQETFTYSWLYHFCDLVRQCACTIYVKPNDGPPLSVDDIRGGTAPRGIV